MKSSAVVLFALLPLSAPVYAADRVANGSFATDLAQWTASGAGISFDGTSGAPTAGSLRINVPKSSPGMSDVVYQCVNYVPAGAIDLLASSQQHSASLGATSLVRLVAYNAPACAGTQLGTFGGAVVGSETGTSGVWSRYGFLGASLPAAAQSFAVQIVVSFPNAGGGIDVSWDHIQFGDAGTLPVELASWTVD